MDIKELREIPPPISPEWIAAFECSQENLKMVVDVALGVSLALLPSGVDVQNWDEASSITYSIYDTSRFDGEQPDQICRIATRHLDDGTAKGFASEMHVFVPQPPSPMYNKLLCAVLHGLTYGIYGQVNIREATPIRPEPKPKGTGALREAGPTVQTQLRFQVFSKIKAEHPTWSQWEVAREACKPEELGESVTADTVRNTYRSMGVSWLRGDRVR